jgi:hypothetical protein
MLEKFKSVLPLNPRDRAVVDKRAAEIRASYLLEEGKCKLAERKFDKARELLAEANDYLHRSSLSLAVLGLGIAPNATGKLITFLRRVRNGAPA